MKKTVYSLVLSEDVVREIDKLATRRGTNRSNMVNQILAEYTSLITPEKRMSHLLSEVRRHFEEAAGFSASGGQLRRYDEPANRPAIQVQSHRPLQFGAFAR